ncbi:outer membrane biosynthesis protein TonB [Aeromicrobium panaciterrae]|uniref:Outer membrane biosynthesis protein TonB n=1 Tax=Aeromicrobium panaciterrae TaxID=363861 RepID=A0ABU1UJ48_9ACTN|nr:hypothetical protein [Aeromicrobium panaciterrae]MDR7085165.1 outer membrane biosynthesis protein TonB [Aeromicrobium panaciterrae]
MNRIIRNLVIAVPLATVGFTMVNATAATAGPNDQDLPIVIKPKGGDPEPKPDFPIKDAPKPNKPKPQPKPAPKPQVVVPQADVVEEKKVVKVISAKGSPDSIDRSENLFVAGPAETELVADDSDNSGLDITWLLVGGGVVTASGIAFAARKRANA